LRSPLRNPASFDGHQKTTELKLVSKFSITEEKIEAGSRSPLHNPASTHGRQKRTTEPKTHFKYRWRLLLIIFAITNLGVTNGNECAKTGIRSKNFGGHQSLLRTQGKIIFAGKEKRHEFAEQCTIWSFADRKWNEQPNTSGSMG
jgi:hypothetical protein